MANFCLMPEAITRFKSALVSGKIDPTKLESMTSEERRALFKDIVGEDAAQHTNALFESKMLLKNKQQGYISWAKKVSGISPEVRRDLISRIQKMDSRVLNPSDEQAFLKDLASTRLGVNVTADEARTISDLSSKISAAETGRSTAEQAAKKGFTPSEGDLAYGHARYDLQKYLSDLKNGASGFKLSDLKSPKGVVQGAAKLPRAIADVSKSIGASLDDSFALRQGGKSLLTHPTYWQKEFRQSFVNLAKGFKDAESAEREFRARLMADPMYDQAVKDGLAVTKNEDVFPTSLPGKIPIAGRAFNASEVAYSAYAENLRLGLYKNELRLAAGKGLEDTGTFGKNVATMINSLTGRGGLGPLERVSGTANVAFYSLRYLKSNLDTLLLHPLGSGVGGTADFIRGVEGAKVTSFAQRRAAQNLVKIVGGMAAILGTANALKPGSVDFDPRSSDFGKIKIGDTRFDVTGGMAALTTLAARIAAQSSKSSTTGKITQLNTGKFGSQTTMDVLVNFLSGKTSPIGGIGVDLLKGKTFSGQKPTLQNEAANLAIPLGIKNAQELLSDPKAANVLAAILIDGLGVSTNTYGNTPQGMNGVTAPIADALTKAHLSVSQPSQNQRNTDLTDAQYQKFTDESNKFFIDAVNKALADPSYRNLTPDQQNKTLSKALSEARSKALDDVLPSTRVPKKGDPGYYQYHIQQLQKARNTPKIKSYVQ